MPTAHVNGVETYYEDQGKGTPVLFIHGGFGGAESTLFPRETSVYQGILPPDQFRSITYDRRNAGRSGYITHPFRLEDLARDAVALLNHLSIHRAIVVGDSLGGQLATEVALTWPNRVNELVLCETGARIVRMTPQARMLLPLLNRLPPRWLVRLGRSRILNPPFYSPLGPQTPELLPNALARHTEYKQALRLLPEDRLCQLTMGILRNYAAFIGRDHYERASQLSVPVKIIHGTADTVVPVRRAHVLHKLIEQSELYLLPDLGHGLFYYPEARELLRDLLSRPGA